MKIRLYQIFFYIFIVVNLIGCYSTVRVRTSILQSFIKGDEFVWIKLRTGLYYYFDEDKGKCNNNCQVVTGKAMLIPTDELFEKRDSLYDVSMSLNLINDITVNVNDIEEAEVIRYDPRKTSRATSFWGSLFPSCARTPR